jgi:hypothetical protein
VVPAIDATKLHENVLVQLLQARMTKCDAGTDAASNASWRLSTVYWSRHNEQPTTIPDIARNYSDPYSSYTLSMIPNWEFMNLEKSHRSISFPVNVVWPSVRKSENIDC